MKTVTVNDQGRLTLPIESHRAHADSREGRVRSLDEDELATLGR